MSRKRRTSAVWEFFELTEVVDDAGKKHKKAICKLCEGVTLAYAGGTSNLFNHLEAKHPVAYTKAVPKEKCLRRSKLPWERLLPPVLLLERIESLR